MNCNILKLLLFGGIFFYCDVKAGNNLWAEEVKDGYCPNFASSPYTPSQLECQQRCIRKDGCVGISYGGRRLRRRLCYLCIDDSLKSLQNYRFYRLPVSCEDNNDQLRDDLQEAVQVIGAENLNSLGFNPEMLDGVTCSNLPEKEIWKTLSKLIDFPEDNLPIYCYTLLRSIYNFHRIDLSLYRKGFLNVERFPCRKTCGFCGTFPPEIAETTNPATMTKYEGVTCKAKKRSSNSRAGIKASCIKNPKCWAVQGKTYCKPRKGPHVFTKRYGLVNLKKTEGQEPVWIKDHCADDVQNQDEEGVDCGGVCAKAC